MMSEVAPHHFLLAICVLADFCYLAQASIFSDQSLHKLTGALQLFHDNKDTILQASVCDG